MLKHSFLKPFIVILSIAFISSSLTFISPIQKASASELAPSLELSPTNPAFLKFENSPNHPLNGSVNGDTQSLGYIPPPFLLPDQNTKDLSSNKLSPATSLPEYYDLRAMNKLTEIRDQNPSGSCWAFAAYASLESALMPLQKLDFSENNLKNNSGFDWGPNDGGNDYMSMAYLARWDGPVSEVDDPFDPYSISSPKQQPQKHVQETLLFGDSNKSFSDIKQMIMKYGAVVTSMYMDYNRYLNNSTNSYYYDGAGNYDLNHEVAIVGWDDNYPKEKFLNMPSRNGAFIARNSWGSSWGDHGYFYVSYDDNKFGTENAVFNNAENTNNYCTIYQYDPLGFVESTGYPSSSTPDTAWMANAFIATSSEPLSAVSFYTLTPDSTYEIRVYENFNGTFDTKEPIKAGKIAMAGYHTISLGQNIPLKDGEKFAVSVKLETPNYNYPIPIEMPYRNYSSKATSSPGQSYMSSNGSDWEDITESFANTNVCLKALTTAEVPSTLKSLAADPSKLTLTANEKSEPITLTATYTDNSTAEVTKSATWTSSNPSVATVNVAEDNVTVTGLTTGSTTITGSYGGKQATITVTVITTAKLVNVIVQPGNISVPQGKTQAVKIYAVYSDDSKVDVTKSVELTSKDKTLATVSGAAIKGIKKGKTTVSGMYNDLPIEIPVTITAPLKSLAINPSSLSLAVNSSRSINLKATYTDKSTDDVTGLATWTSSNPTVATVKLDGDSVIVTGLTKGSTTITGSYLGKNATIIAGVTPELVDLIVQPSNVSVSQGSTQSVKIYAVFSDDSKVDVTSKVSLASGDKNIAIITGTKIKGIHLGETTVSGTYNGLPVIIPVTVTLPLKSLSSNPSQIDLTLDESANLSILATYADGSVNDVTRSTNWILSRTGIVEINTNEDGASVHALKAGSLTITGSYGSKRVKIKVKVTK